jgi:signal transduction histidine kinase
MVTNALGSLESAVLGPDRAPSRPRSEAVLWPVFALLLAACVFAGLGSVRIEVAAPLVRVVLAVAAAAPVALAFSSPLIAWRLAALGTLVTVPVGVAPGGLTWPWHPLQLLILPGMVFAVALRHRAGVVAWVAVLSGLAMVVRVSPPDAVTVVAAITIVAVTGVQVRRRVVVRQTAEQTRRALSEQRALLAQELHDVVGHHMSLIAVRAESAPYRLHSHPEAHQAEFTAIAGASREALNDMRRLVGTLATARDQPQLGRIRMVVDRARAAGMSVSSDLDLAGGLTTAVELIGCRIVQEALSNAARHSPGGRVHVSVEVVGDRLRVDVRNTAATRAALPDPNRGEASGNGLTGMRRRVTSAGGTLAAGPSAEGGYRVTAVIPRAGASQPAADARNR